MKKTLYILFENQNQNNRIKFLELKEKSKSLYKKEDYNFSLEFLNEALKINENDNECLQIKASILVRTNQLEDAIRVYKKSLNANPENKSNKINLLEALYLNNSANEAKELITTHDIHVEPLLDEFFELFSLYYSNEEDKLKSRAKSYSNDPAFHSKSQRFVPWNYKDALFVIYYLPESKLKEILHPIADYWAGIITGKQLFSLLKISPPENETIKMK